VDARHLVLSEKKVGKLKCRSIIEKSVQSRHRHASAQGGGVPPSGKKLLVRRMVSLNNCTVIFKEKNGTVYH